jgi:predicted dienelactone hydrolase
MPITQQRLPVVVLLHGSGGVRANVRHKPATREECLKAGATIGFDPRAYADAMRRIKEALVASLGGG